MTHAYSELYLNDAKDTLSLFFDYLINDCNLDADWVAGIFVSSGWSEQFERGNPSVIAGMSGIELAYAVIRTTYEEKKLSERMFSDGYSPEYWAGWALAWYQWFSGRRFSDIFDAVSFREIVRMYGVYHEMDISRFFEVMESLMDGHIFLSRLRSIRENRGLSQSELARVSGINIRSIQMYEQGVNDIDKAQAITLYRLSRAIGCRIEDLLQKPSM